MDERILELSRSVSDWLIGDWAFRKDKSSYPCPVCIDTIYLHLAKTTSARNAAEMAVALTIQGVFDGKTYEQIIETHTGDKKGA